MSERPKLLLLIDTRTVSGPSRGILQFLEHGGQDRVSCAVGMLRYGGEKEPALLAELRRQGRNGIAFPSRGSFDPGVIRSVGEYIRREGIQLLQSHGYKTHLFAAILSRMHRLPWVAFAHGWTTEDAKMRLYHRLDILT